MNHVFFQVVGAIENGGELRNITFVYTDPEWTGTKVKLTFDFVILVLDDNLWGGMVEEIQLPTPNVYLVRMSLGAATS